MPWLSERHPGSRPDTWRSLLRTAQPQGGGWYLVAKSRLSETEGSQAVLETRRLRPPQQGLGAVGKGEASSPGCQGDAEASDCPGGPVAQIGLFQYSLQRCFRSF